MMVRARTAHTACRLRKYQGEWLGPIWAMIADALYTISTPENTMASTVKKRIQSVLSLWAMSIFRCQLVHDLFEELATVLVALELVEAGAGGRQQHGVAGHGVRVGISDGGFDGLGRDQRHGALKLVGDLGSGGSNQRWGEPTS